MLRDDLKSDILFMLSEIDRELEVAAPLFQIAEKGKLDPIHTMAAATVLHSFYNGLESIFFIIHKRLDEETCTGVHWHRNLLKSMEKSTKNRDAVLSPEATYKLRDFLAFRHRFRHGYGWQLDPLKITPKLKELPGVYELVKAQIMSFLHS